MNAATQRQRKRGLHTNSKAWRAIRNQVLAWEPLCRYCGDAAVHVDHLDNDSHNQDIDNLVAMCASCHSSKTATEQAGRTWKPKGCDVDGWPIDGSHPWNAKDREQPSANGTRPQSLFHAKDRP